MTFGDIAPPLLFLVVTGALYLAVSIGRDRAVAERDAWRRQQAERAASTPAE